MALILYCSNAFNLGENIFYYLVTGSFLSKDVAVWLWCLTDRQDWIKLGPTANRKGRKITICLFNN